MKHRFLGLLFFLCSVLIVSAQAEDFIAIDTAHFPDDIFRAYVLNTFDSDGDENLSQKEILSARKMDISRNEENLKNLQGIEYFTSLEYLDCSNNALTALDLVQSPNLKSLNCSKNRISDLDLSNHKELYELDCSFNGLTSLNLAGCRDLHDIRCQGNALASIDISDSEDLPGLTTRVTPSTQTMTYFDSSNKMRELTYIEYFGGYCLYLDLGTTIVTDNPTGGVPLDENHFPDGIFRDYIGWLCDWDDNSYLSEKEIESVESIAIYHKATDKHPDAGWNCVRSLKGIEYFLNLRYLDCQSQCVESLDVSHNPKLETIWCQFNKMKTLTLGNLEGQSLFLCESIQADWSTLFIPHSC